MREYKIRPETREILHQNKITNRKIAQKLGVTEGYISQIVNCKKTNISKLLAYAFCKAIHSDLEIEDIFEVL